MLIYQKFIGTVHPYKAISFHYRLKELDIYVCTYINTYVNIDLRAFATRILQQQRDMHKIE